MTGTAIARAQEASKTVAIRTDEQLREFLTARQGEFALLAKASGAAPEELVAEIVLAARENPDILKCEPESIVSFMYDVARSGLYIGKGVFAVPVRDNKRGVTNLEAWYGYKGMRELVKAAGGARDVFAEIRFEGDPFEEVLGLYPDVKHRKGEHFGDMKKALGVYAVAVISQTIRRHKYLSRADVDRLRKLNRGDTTSPRSPWTTNEAAMWKAKAILALCNDLPSTPRLAKFVARVNASEGLAGADEEGRVVPNERIASTPTSSAPAAATPASEFEVEEEERAIVTIPNWRNHPLAGKTLQECSTDDLAALYSRLSDVDPANSKDLILHIEAELDARRNSQ